MKKRPGKWLCLVLALVLLASLTPRARAYEIGDAYRRDLSAFIENPQRRQYVEMMLDHYIRTDTMVQQALDGGFCAVFLFDGASDNMDEPQWQDLSFFRVTGVVIVLKKDAAGDIKMLYFNDNCTTIPDKPLKYGAWWLPEAGDVGPATICDGTYQMYSVLHKGKYEALHLRTEYFDHYIDAVYMTPEGYVQSRASEINVHTRTSNHISGSNSMWSAGCPLVGDGDNWEFWKLIYATYYTQHETFEVDNFLGTMTIDRQAMKEELYELYATRAAVDQFLLHSTAQQPQAYLRQCTPEETYKRPQERKVVLGTQVMSLPCSNATDARSLVLDTVGEGEMLSTLGTVSNSAGNLWYQVAVGEQTGYVFSGHMEKDSFADWLFKTLFT